MKRLAKSGEFFVFNEVLRAKEPSFNERPCISLDYRRHNEPLDRRF